jgi:acetoin utilization protein AcuB
VLLTLLPDLYVIQPDEPGGRKATMKIESWMKRSVVTVKPHDSVLHARELLEKHRINQLPVTVDGRLIGIVTDRDLRDAFPSVFEIPGRRRKSRSNGADPTAVAIEDVMSRNVVTMAPEARVVDAARVMRRERIGAIPVLEHERLVGIITRSDLLDSLIEVAGPGSGA